MAGIKFLIEADYKQVDAAIAKIEELKKVIINIRADDPKAKEIIGQIEEQKKKIAELAEEIRRLTEEKAKQAQEAINDNKKQEAEIARLAAAYKDLYAQMNNEASKPKKIEDVAPPSMAQSQAATETMQEAMAYEELNRQILLVAGSRQNNITRLLREQAALDSVKKELSNLTKEEKATGKTTEEQRKKRTELVSAEYEHKQAISSLQKVIKNDVKLNQEAEGSYKKLSLSLERMKEVYKGFSDEMTKSSFGVALQKQIDEADKKLKDFSNTIGENQRNVGNYPSYWNQFEQSANGALNVISAFPGPLGQAASSMQGLTKASLRFIATPIGAVLAAISVALASLSSWFTRTQEGEEALNVTSAYFKQTLDSILDVVDDVGEWLYNAFTKPKEAAIDFVDFIKSQVLNRLSAMGKAGEALIKIFSGDFKAGFNDFANALAQGVTGVEDVTGKVSKFIDDASTKAQKKASLAERENKLIRDQNDWLVKRSKLEAQINELREKSQSSYLSESERLEASKKASALINQLYQKEIKLAEEERDIIAETNTLSHSNTEAKRKEAEATAKVNKLTAERAAKNRELLSQQRELQNRLGTYKSKSAQRIKEIEENSKKVEEKEREVEMSVEEARINAMENGYEKQNALIQLENKKRLNDVTKMGQELLKIQQENERKLWEAENPNAAREGKTFIPLTQSVTQLSQEKLNILVNMMNAIAINTEKKQADLLKATLDKYKDFSVQRLEIEKTYNEDIAYLQGQRNDSNADRIDAAIQEATKKYKESLSKVNLAEFQEEIDWNIVFSDFDKISTNSLLSLRDKLKGFLSNIGSSLTKEDMKVVMDAFDKMNKEISDRKPIEQLKSSYDDFKKSSEEVAKAQQAVNDAEKEGGKSSEGYKKALKQLTEAQDKRRESLSKMTDAVNSIGEKGQELVNAGNNIVGMLTDLGVSVPESITGALEGIGQVASSLASIDLTKPFSIITGVAGAIGGIGKAIGSLFNKDSKREKNITRLQDQVDILQKSYDNLGNAIDKAYSTDASKLIEQQNEMLEQQKVLIQQQIKEEEDKKHTDKERIEEWKQQIEEINATLDENKERQIDAIFGSDVQSAIDDFATAYVDAWAAGEDKAASMKDVVKKMIKGIVVEMLKADLAKPVEELRKKIKDMMVDGIIDQYEEDQINKIVEQISKDADRKYSWADRFIKDQNKEEEPTRTSSSKGIESMSQDSANELNGKFTAGLIYLDKTNVAVSDIAGGVKELLRQNFDGWKNVEAIRDISSNIELLNTKILNNTENIESVLKSINSQALNTNRTIDSINANGLRMKK